MSVENNLVLVMKHELNKSKERRSKGRKPQHAESRAANYSEG